MARNAAGAGLNLVVRLDMPPDWARAADIGAKQPALLTGLTQSHVIASASFDKLRTWFAKQSPSPSRRLLRPEGCWRNRTLRSSQ
jgi:hypothetical protein